MDSGWGTTGGGPSRSPFWRTPKESCKGLGSVTFKINTQHTPLEYAIQLVPNSTKLDKLNPNNDA